MAKQLKSKIPAKKKPKGLILTRIRKESINSLAVALGQIAPSTTYGNSFSIENLAKEWNLEKYFKKQKNKVADIDFFLSNVIRQYPRLPKKLVLEIVKRGSIWKATNAEVISAEMLEAIAIPMEALGFTIRKELAELSTVELPHVTPLSFKFQRLLKDFPFHSALEREIPELFLEGHYNEAIRKSLERFEEYIKNISGLHDQMGKDLMAKSFSGNTPLITLNSLNSTNDKSEQEGFQFMTMGAMRGLRNILSHGDTEQFEVSEALELLCFVSFLFKRVDRRTL